MYPMYGWTHSYSQPRNQMMYPPYHTQSFESVPPYMKMDPARPAMFEPWPYGGSSYGYSYPTECHGCCNHNNYFPGHYGFRPPYPHFAPPSPQYYHGSYPAFFGGYPGYQSPPSHYSMEKPRYEYDKGFSKDQHCCGCPNHSCKKVPDKNVENEEREMDTNKASLVPSNLSDLPFPFVMIPPGYQMDSEGRKFTKSQGKENKKVDDDVKCDKSSKFLKQEKETQRQQDLQSQFPFPLFWLPYESDEVEKQDKKGMSSGHKAVIAPVQEKNEEVKNPSSESGPKMVANGESQMTTPVKKAEHVEEKKKEEERKVKAIPVLQADDNQEKGSARNGDKKRTPSPKSSKLPPVCLRIDPVSKPKKGNGNSRSPSPPADKGRSRQSSNENTGSLGQNELSQNLVDKNREKEIESRKKTINVVEGTTTEGRTEAQTNYHHVLPSHEEVSSRKSEVEGGNDVVNQDAGEAIEREEARLEGQIVNKEEDEKVRKKMMSDVEAVSTIQSVYRGYEVRKSEPLKKLRQIAEVTRKMLEVKGRISALDSCSDVEIDEKQLVAIGETIMSLLLKLDTIQGLNPCVRDIRKSVAKELVSLQEKLDSSSTRKKPQASIVHPSSETPDGGTANMRDNDSVQNNQNEAEVVLDSTQVGGIETDAQSGENTVDNGISGPESLELSEPSPVSTVDQQRTSSGREMELEDQKNQVPNSGDDQMTAENEGSLEIETSVFLADEKADNGGEVADSTSLVESDGKVGEVAELINLPQGVPETTDTQGDLTPSEDSIVEDLEVDTATEYITPGMDQLDHVKGNLEKNMNATHESEFGPEEMHDGESRVKDVGHMEKHEEAVVAMEPRNFSSNEDQQVQNETSVQEKEATHDITEDLKETNGNIKPSTSVKEKEATDITDSLKEANIELSTPMQEKEATDVTDDVKEACITLEPVPQVVKDRVHDGETDKVFDKMKIEESDENAQLSPEESLTKELSMKNNMVGQSQMTIGYENPGKVDMENGSEMVGKGVDRDSEVMEENMRLKEMIEKLMEAGNEKLATITKLSGKVKDLEKKLTKKSKLKTKKPSRGKRQNGMVLV